MAKITYSGIISPKQHTMYSGWPNKNAPSFMSQHFLLVIDGNLIFCPQIDHSFLS